MLFCQNSGAFYSYFIHAKGPSSIHKTEPKARKRYSLHEKVIWLKKTSFVFYAPKTFRHP
jgi:hypothetical protein